MLYASKDSLAGSFHFEARDAAGQNHEVAWARFHRYDYSPSLLMFQPGPWLCAPIHCLSPPPTQLLGWNTVNIRADPEMDGVVLHSELGQTVRQLWTKRQEVTSWQQEVKKQILEQLLNCSRNLAVHWHQLLWGSGSYGILWNLTTNPPFPELVWVETKKTPYKHQSHVPFMVFQDQEPLTKPQSCW